MPPTRARSASAIGRSLDIYYRDHARAARMDALHRALVPEGALVFDIGAHLGDRTGSFLRQGARVVALEPQPRLFRALRLIHGAHPRARLVRAAAGAAPGEMTLHLNSRNPTVATLEPGFIEAATGAPGWEGQVWDDALTVPVTTLDALIAEHGAPDFVKIDVEGHEPAVLSGLSRALPLLSFEFTTIQRAAAHACLSRLEALGRYAFSLSLGEEHRLRQDPWLEGAGMRRVLDALPPEANAGDIYARLQ